MSLLEEATMSEMVDFIGQSLKEAEAADDEQPAAEAAVEVESSEASEDVNEEDASPSETVEDVKEETEEEPEQEVVVAQDEPEEKRQKDSKWVPRDRLNDVNEKWRQREQQLLLQIGALEERARQPRPAPQQSAEAGEPDWLDNFVGEGNASNPDIEQLKSTQAQVLKWQEEFTRQMIYKEFNEELQAAMTKYPDIPEKAFRDAVVRDGSVNMLEFGERMSNERNELVSKWKADWEASQGAKAPEAEAEAETAAVRRPSRRTAAPPPPKAKPETYSTVREAGDAMAKEMAAFFENLQD